MHQNTVYVEPDGSFRLDDVPPRTYYLTIWGQEKLEGGRWGNIIAQGTSEVIILPGAMPSDGPIDVGNIILVKVDSKRY